MAIYKIYDFFIIHFTKHLSKMNNFPNVIQGIGLALLTILIPLAIAILADIYQKRREEKGGFIDLDLHVILDRVFNIRLIILSVFLIFLPMFFWEILIGLDKLIAVLLTFIGLILVVDIIFKVSRWIKGNVFDFRFSYLRKLNNYNDLEIVWRSVWQVEKINFQYEKEFCKIFFLKIDHLLGLPQNSLKITSILLNDFYNFINKRSIILLLEPNITFARILEWHFKTWQNEYIYIKKYLDSKDKAKSSFNYREILRVLDSILSNIEERSFKDQEAFSFFIHFKKHAEKYKDELVGNGNKHYYINYLFDSFYKVFFKNIEKANFSEDDFIWEPCFPKEWKVSKVNLLDKEKQLFTNLSLICFLNWAQKRINWATEKKDFVLGKVASNLFPEIDSNLLLELLVFVVLGSGNKNRIKFTIEKPWDFGFVIRSKLYPIETGKQEMKKKMSEDIEREEQGTYELVSLLFKKDFSKENIAQYIKEIKELKYPEGSNEENEKNELLDIFNGMLEYLNK